MKHLYLIRHAKSSWDNNLIDKERPLNMRGKKDAPYMGAILKEKNINPDLIITSPAVRALTTAKIFSKKLNYPFEKIVIEPKIYAADSSNILKVIHELNDNYNLVMLFGHNPGITELAEYLSNKIILNIPTCGVFSIKCRIKSWEKLDNKNASFNSFEYPKKYSE